MKLSDAITRITNCPNCGGILTESIGYLRCQYCGTVIYDYATIDADGPFWIRVKQDGVVTLAKVLLTQATVVHHEDLLPMSSHDLAGNQFLFGYPTLELNLTILNTSEE